jgi:hypothetical protein
MAAVETVLGNKYSAFFCLSAGDDVKEEVRYESLCQIEKSFVLCILKPPPPLGSGGHII